MALTIRTLSDSAENTLEKLIEKNETINTKSRAVEYALEQYFIITERLDDEKRKSQKLQRELLDAEIDLQKIAQGFEIIEKIRTKYKD